MVDGDMEKAEVAESRIARADKTYISVGGLINIPEPAPGHCHAICLIGDIERAVSTIRKGAMIHEDVLCRIENCNAVSIADTMRI